MEVLNLITLIIAICFIIHGVNSLRSFNQTIELIKKGFPLYSKKKHHLNLDKLPYIFILAPVLKEEQTIVPFLENLSRLDYNPIKYEVIIITTEKEYYYQNQKNSKKTTIERVDEYLSEKQLPNFRRIHYPFTYGHKTDQLNYAINILKKEVPVTIFNNAFFCIYDADSLIHKESLKIFANSLKENYFGDYYVFQQPHLWLKNFNELPQNFNGYLMKSFALLHTYYVISYEIPMLNREYNKFPYQMKYCMGHGLFVKGDLLEKIKGFPSLIEDTRLGHVCSFLKINIKALPVFGVVDVTKNFKSLIKQISVWFTGEALVLKDFSMARVIKKEVNLLDAFFMLFYKILKNLGWMNEGLLFITGISIGIFLKNILIISLYFLILLINVWGPMFLLLNKTNWLLEPYELSVKEVTVKEKLILLITSVVIFCFSFLGPYLGVFRLVKFSISKKPLILPKTER